jgi:hypothetical protein
MAVLVLVIVCVCVCGCVCLRVDMHGRTAIDPVQAREGWPLRV